MISITNDTQLDAILEDITKDIVKKFGISLQKEVKSSVQRYVYEAHPAGKYERSMGFLNSWVMEDVKSGKRGSAKCVKSSVYSDPEKMTVNLDLYQHGDSLDEDRRSILPEMLNEGYAESVFDTVDNQNGWWKEPRFYFDPVIVVMEDNWFDRELASGFRKLGIKVK